MIFYSECGIIITADKRLHTLSAHDTDEVISMTLGEKLKALRKARGMTQAQLAGDRITRNMLSSIERDAALPSYETLRFLGKELAVNPGCFFDDDADLLSCLLRADMPKIRAAFNEGSFDECISTAEPYKDCSDTELFSILSYAHYRLAIAAFEGFAYDEAKNHFKESSALIERMDVKPYYAVRISFFLSLIDSKRTGKQVLPSSVISAISDNDDFFDYAVYNFLLALIETDQIEKATSLYNSLRIGNHLYRSHFNARIAASLNNYQRAKELLWSVVNSSEAVPSPFLYGVYEDLERYCKATDDYEGAYRCAVARQDMKNR